MRSYFSTYAPALKDTQYGKEIWALYEGGFLQPEQVLTGKVELDERPADVESVLEQVELAIEENELRRMFQP